MSGCSAIRLDEPDVERDGERQSRHIGAPAALGKEPGGDDDERRLGDLGGLEGMTTRGAASAGRR